MSTESPFCLPSTGALVLTTRLTLPLRPTREEPLAHIQHFLFYRDGVVPPVITVIEAPTPENDQTLIVEVEHSGELRHAQVVRRPSLRSGWDCRVVDPLTSIPILNLYVEPWSNHIHDWAEEYMQEIGTFLEETDPNIWAEITRSNELLCKGWKPDQDGDDKPPHDWVRFVFAQQGIYTGILELAVSMGFTHPEMPVRPADHPEFVVTNTNWKPIRIPVR